MFVCVVSLSPAFTSSAIVNAASTTRPGGDQSPAFIVRLRTAALLIRRLSAASSAFASALSDAGAPFLLVNATETHVQVSA